MRWIDNDEVDMCTTVHDGYETILKKRKRPRENQFNKKHVREVWGTDWGANIDIPKIIDDYNNLMGGVDKAYQLIGYYRPKLRCRRTWMPMWLHSLDICRLNSYIIAKSKNVYSNQKEFVLDWISALNNRADYFERQRTRAAIQALTSPPSSATKKPRIRMKKTDPQLPLYRFSGRRQDHVHVITTEQRGCTYCKYLRAKAKAADEELLPEVSRPLKKCLMCGDNLCALHFDAFHER
jgi:hypothetical protein